MPHSARSTYFMSKVKKERKKEVIESNQTHEKKIVNKYAKKNRSRFFRWLCC